MKNQTSPSPVKVLKLNLKTITILDDMALQNIKGGRSIDADDTSCTSGACNTSCKTSGTLA